MPMLHLPRPARGPLLLLLIVIILLTLTSLSFRQSPPSTILQPRHPSTRYTIDERLQTASLALLSVGDVIAEALDAVAGSVAEYDHSAGHNEFGFHLGNVSLEGYERDLRDTWEGFFATRPVHADQSKQDPDTASPSPSTPPLLTLILSHLSPLPARPSVLPKHIYTTDLLPPSSFPEQFLSWGENNPDWTTRYVSDEGIGSWLEEVLPGSGVEREMRALGGRRGVVRADLFR